MAIFMLRVALWVALMLLAHWVSPIAEGQMRRGGCANGNCGGGEQMFMPLAERERAPVFVEYNWTRLSEGEPGWWTCDSDTERYFLYRNSRPIGAWDKAKGHYRAWYAIGKRWGKAQDAPPVPLPDGHAPEKVYFGVDKDKLSSDEKVTIKGKPISLAEAKEILESSANCKAGELCDDSKKGHLTVVSADPAMRKRVLDDLASAPALAAYKPSLRVQAYDPGDKIAKALLAPFKLEQDARFLKSGVAVLVQGPENPAEGKSRVYPIYSYTGPDELAKSLRNIDPNYDPNKNKEPAPPAAPLGLPSWPPIVWIGAAGAGFLLLKKGGHK